MRILVAGATGYLGRHVVRACAERGWRVRALVRDPAKLDRPGRFLEPPVRACVEDVFVGRITEPETLRGACDGVDAVFSSVGITRQRDGRTYRDVDFQGNVNLLREAVAARARKFVYVSVFGAERLGRLAIVRAHEDFVRELERAGMPHTIVRPTGYFSDMGEVLGMARHGLVALLGSGENRINPIHGADLAEVCVAAIERTERAIAAGGPEVFTQNDIAALAFDVLGRKPRIVHLPPLLGRGVVAATRPFDRQLSDLVDFLVTGAQVDAVAPPTGTQRLRDWFAALAARDRRLR